MEMKKLKHEAELLKAVISAGMNYAETRGAENIETTNSNAQKILYLYRLFVNDKLIQPIPENQISQKAMRHILAMWMVNQLPEDHPFLN
jgi:hypothetical protein